MASITGQTFDRAEILLIANGCGRPTLDLLSDLARSEPRARVLELPEANLAAALNAGIKSARCELIARMDIDDWSHPDRLAEQRSYMIEHPDVALVACGWVRVNPSGERESRTPPSDPRDMRWRLLVENPIAHGSVMFRRSPVIEVGGYDPSCLRAQDHDLWLRLSERHPLAAVPRDLYEYHARHAGGQEAPVADQALTSSRSMVRSWSGLAPAGERVSLEVASAIAPLVAGARTHDQARFEIERILREHGTSREAIIGRLWVEWNESSRSGRTDTFCRISRIRAVTGSMKSQGASSLYLWGAGRHTRWLLEHHGELRIPVAGIVDDVVFGTTRLGFSIGRPEDLSPGDWVLISSDGFEDEIWESSEAVRGRGVNVWRMYERNPGE